MRPAAAPRSPRAPRVFASPRGVPAHHSRDLRYARRGTTAPGRARVGHEARAVDDGSGACQGDAMMRTLRLLLAVQAASLLAAAALHAGLVIPGRFDQAALYEGSLGVILAIALGLTFGGPVAARVAGLAAQALALAGASLGLYLALRGIAPNTPLDLVYHVVLIGLLV